MIKITRKYFVAAAIIVFVGALTIFGMRNDFGLGRNMEIAVNVMRALSVNYVDSVDTERMLRGAADGMTKQLDPYTTFLSEQDMSQFDIMITGKYGGIGSLIRQKGDYVYIAEPYRNSPADRSGLRIGDKIVAIDGKSAKGMSISEVSNLLKGEPNTTVRVTVEPLVGSGEVEHKIRRERISIPGIAYAGYVADGVGYIQHRDFTDGCYEQMRAAIERLRAEGDLRSLVLDYRDNGGGIMQEAVKIVSLFVPKGTQVLQLKGRAAESNSTFRTELEPVAENLPLVVLIDDNSASSSEIVAGALQDLDRAVLVGRRSFGKGLVQSTLPVGYNTVLKLTTAKYYIPSGRCIQAVRYSSDGSAEEVADSLRNEFRTAHGRKVLDGGGIMPDITTEAEYVSRFAMTLYAMGYIEDFVDEYIRRNPENEISAADFSITDADYGWFEEFMKDKDVAYKSESRRLLEALKASLERERYNAATAQIEQIDHQLKDDKQSNLQTYRHELTQLLNANIILRKSYADGVTANMLRSDKTVRRAVELLTDRAEYERILAAPKQVITQAVEAKAGKK